jgi:hypothetical protein
MRNLYRLLENPKVRDDSGVPGIDGRTLEWILKDRV